jgi:glycosyltransferase involved in cell wall biosynthesis
LSPALELLGTLRSVALVHDYLLVMRGAERTFAAIAECCPRAPVYTLLYDEEATGRCFGGHHVTTSALQRLPIRQHGFRVLLPAFPAAVGRLPTGGHDVVLSSTSAFAHGVRVDPGATHISYCHSPFRYAWHERGRLLDETPRALRPIARRLVHRLRSWDLRAARGVSHFIANSQLTRQRIHEFWDREASVVHPPVDVDRFHPAEPEDYFLVVGEMVPHKRVDAALEAARSARCRIKVVGTGPDLSRLVGRAGPGAQFLGRLPDAELADVYARARALVVPGVEEFGITAVEAQAAGRPVIAVNAGGALETVVDGETGVLVEPGVDALAEAMRHVDFDGFSPERIRRHAQSFSRAVFIERFSAEVARVLQLPQRALAT